MYFSLLALGVEDAANQATWCAHGINFPDINRSNKRIPGGGEEGRFPSFCSINRSMWCLSAVLLFFNIISCFVIQEMPSVEHKGSSPAIIRRSPSDYLVDINKVLLTMADNELLLNSSELSGGLYEDFSSQEDTLKVGLITIHMVRGSKQVFSI